MQLSNSATASAPAQLTTTSSGDTVLARIPVTRIVCTCEEATSFHAPSLDGADPADRIRIAAKLLEIQEGLQEIFEDCEPSKLGYLEFSTSDPTTIQVICRRLAGQTTDAIAGSDFYGGEVFIAPETQMENYECEITEDESQAINWPAAFDCVYVIDADGSLTLQS